MKEIVLKRQGFRKLSHSSDKMQNDALKHREALKGVLSPSPNNQCVAWACVSLIWQFVLVIDLSASFKYLSGDMKNCFF